MAVFELQKHQKRLVVEEYPPNVTHELMPLILFLSGIANATATGV